MSNAPKIHLTMLDRLAAELPKETRDAIILDLDAFEQDGASRPGPLRDHATRFYQQIHHLERGFDAAYLFRLGMSCHKLNSIEAMSAGMSTAPEDLLRDLAGTSTIREQAIDVLKDSGAQPTSADELDALLEGHLCDGRGDLNEHASDSLEELIGRARSLLGISMPSPEEELSLFDGGEYPAP